MVLACRTCAASVGDLISMYDEKSNSEVKVQLHLNENNEEEISIIQIVNECISNKVTQGDPLPKEICLKCFEDAKIAYSFRKKSENSFKSLMILLNDNKNTNEEIAEDDDDDIESIHFEEFFQLDKKYEDDVDIPPTEKCIQTDDVCFHLCEKCESKFINYNELKDHRYKFHKGDENKCRVCSKTYNRLMHLKRHIAKEHPELGFQAKFECTECNKRYTRSDRLNRHIKVCHQNQEDQGKIENAYKLFCRYCVKFYKNSKEFNIHYNKCRTKRNAIKAIVRDKSPTSVTLGEPESIILEEQTKKTNEQIYTDMKSNSDNDHNDSDDKSDSDNDEEDSQPLAKLISENKSSIQTNQEELEIKSKVEETKPKEKLNSPLKTLEESPKSIENSNLPSKTARVSQKLAEKSESCSKTSVKPKKPRKFHKCEQCDKVFSRSTHVKRHALIHCENKPFTCNECDKGFTRLDHLNLHKLKHSDKKDFICDVCNRAFVRSDQLRKHKENRHGARPLNPKTEFCNICKRFFSSAKYLQIHIKSHADRQFNCKHCEEVFKTKTEMVEHSKTHVNEKPYLCSQCGLRFVRNDYLVIHMRRHKGEKPYKCKFCGKGFPRGSDLNVHERYHTGEKTHLCTICGKGFQRAYNLLVHTRVHTGERPYQCPHCSKSFAQGNDLKAHIRRHTGERFKCEICDCGFIQGYHLTQHKRNVHGIDTKSHIRRVQKFVTPIEQQKQVEALQNILTKGEKKSSKKIPVVRDTLISNEIKQEIDIEEERIPNTRYIVLEDSTVVPITINAVHH